MACERAFFAVMGNPDLLRYITSFQPGKRHRDVTSVDGAVTAYNYRFLDEFKHLRPTPRALWQLARRGTRRDFDMIKYVEQRYGKFTHLHISELLQGACCGGRAAMLKRIVDHYGCADTMRRLSSDLIFRCITSGYTDTADEIAEMCGVHAIPADCVLSDDDDAVGDPEADPHDSCGSAYDSSVDDFVSVFA